MRFKSVLFRAELFIENRPNTSLMKLRITITGPRVHDVSYRYLLLGGAMGLRLPGFDANNLTDGESQVVDIAIDGKESQIEAFKEFVQINRPSGAEVSSISVSDYEGEVMRMAEYAQVLAALLMLRANLIMDSSDPSKRIE